MRGLDDGCAVKGFSWTATSLATASTRSFLSPFRLPSSPPMLDGPARTSIEGTIFRGHFERRGKRIAQGVVTEVHRVVYFVVRPTWARNARRTGKPTDLCFGRAGRLHLAHEVTARPDFDHVLYGRVGSSACSTTMPPQSTSASFVFQ